MHFKGVRYLYLRLRRSEALGKTSSFNKLWPRLRETIRTDKHVFQNYTAGLLSILASVGSINVLTMTSKLQYVMIARTGARDST